MDKKSVELPNKVAAEGGAGRFAPAAPFFCCNAPGRAI